MTSVDPKTTIRGILDALREDIDDEASWNALIDCEMDLGFIKQNIRRDSMYQIKIDVDGVRTEYLNHATKLNAINLACQHIATAGKSQIGCIQFHFNGYAEPGYTDPASGIIATGNWNSVTGWTDGGKLDHSDEIKDDTPELLSDLLENLGVEIEWFYEWADCEECGKLVRTQSDGMDWQPHYHCGDGWLVCNDCWANNPVPGDDDEPEEENPFEFDDPSVNPMA